MEIVMFNTEQKIVVKEFLQSVVKGNLSVINNKEFGICYSMREVLNDTIAYKFVENNCSDWEHFSGNKAIPVPQSFWCNNLWKRKQLKLRKLLCQHLLTKLD
jgi:hypothetical protein